jgi:sugar phosphate permease
MALVLAGGFVSRLMQNRRKPVIVLAVGLTLLSVVMLEVCMRAGLGRGWVLLCYVLLGVTSLCSPVGTALMKESNPPEAVGTAIGVSNAASYLVVAVISNAAGFVMDAFRSSAVTTATTVIYPRAAYETIFVGCIVLAAGAFACSLCLRESHGKSIYKADG